MLGKIHSGIPNIQTTIKAFWFKAYALSTEVRPYARREHRGEKDPVLALHELIANWKDNRPEEATTVSG